MFAEAQGGKPEELITFAIWYLGISIIYLGKYIIESNNDKQSNLILANFIPITYTTSVHLQQH